MICEPDGTWRAGRYVGSLIFEGHKLDIRPRYGEETLRAWFAGALNVALVETEGSAKDSDLFVPWLMATIWSRAFVTAARHGLPALRSTTHESGLTVRGRLDVQGTIRMRAAGSPGAASMRLDKTLDHAISAAIVAAYAELTRLIGKRLEDQWLPQRVKDLLLHLVAATGPRPKIPTLAEIDAVRLTPITAGFHHLAELSARIASSRGLAAGASNEGSCKGVLLDVAELWELYVLSALCMAWPGADVMHGTRTAADTRALLSNANGVPLGFLRPDALIAIRGKVVAVVDAKYKSLQPTYHTAAPQREDLYQLVAYLGRYGHAENPIFGALAYPADPTATKVPLAEQQGPWFLEKHKAVRFLTLPHKLEEAAAKLRDNLGPF
ncbi:hypothetical protein PQR25_36795 [Paraburkholderia nemoris]|uniref:5-methylcytosine restriction system specificity protein McrC n=1 Tax=Paraburkholderia nemoris TaxID=2793076 RepID=UPI0038BE014D